MKIKYVYWEVDCDGINGVSNGELEVSKFSVGCCMEKFYEDMGDFSWSENSDGYNFNKNKSNIIVEGIDGDVRWVFVKAL